MSRRSVVVAATSSTGGGGVFVRRLRFAATGAILCFTGVGSAVSFHALHRGGIQSIGAAISSVTVPAPKASGSSSSGGSQVASVRQLSATQPISGGGGGGGGRGIALTAGSFLGFGAAAAGGFTTSAAEASGTGDGDMGGATVIGLGARADHSWLAQLTADPETARFAPNRSSRQVKSGHYVRVAPSPLTAPRLVIHSPAMAASLGITEEDVASPAFSAFFSGDAAVVPGMETWATPYALSIMGKRQTSNCPFGNGNGYGDGRAVSVGEVVVEGRRWEMQLKGGGPTPFCRGADGRAVLRSSIREFLASEAMHNLNVSTTRALSLVVSEGGDVVRRPWYKPEDAITGGRDKISMDDPRLARFDEATRRQIIRQAASQQRDPDVMVVEACAITTRVAPSFTRIGHLDLFSRRAATAGPGTPQHRELEQMVRHAIFREFPEVLEAHPGPGGEGGEAGAAGGVAPEAAAAFLRASAAAISDMVAGWLRVGFCQGNFNADNCLVGGRTMDYGPFGWMDAYDPLFAKWVGSGEHFAFMNQPGAGVANFAVLAASVAPLLQGGEAEAQRIVVEAQGVMDAAVADMWRRKLGLAADAPDARAAAAALFDDHLEPLMRAGAAEVDYTLMWRQLAEVAALPQDAADADLFAPLRAAFYSAPDAAEVANWTAFLRRWRGTIGGDGAEAAARVRAESPKYILREWMLVEAYTAAKERGDFTLTHELFDLTAAPYAEGSDAMAAKYYRRAPDAALNAGGTAFMS